MDAPAAHRAALAEHRRRRQAEVNAHMHRLAGQKLELPHMHRVAEFRVDRLAVAHEAIVGVDVDLDPVLGLAGHLALVVAAAGLAPNGIALGQRQRVGRLVQPVEVLGAVVEAARLAVERPALGLVLLGQAIPPVIVVRRVGAGQDARPGRAAHGRRRVAAHPAGEAVEHRLGHLARLVDPRAGELHAQQLGDVLRPVEADEDHLQVEVALLDVVRRRAGVDPAADRRRDPLVPGLDRRGAQLGVGVADDRPARALLAVEAGPLHLGAAHDLHHAHRGLARAERAHQAAEERVVEHERARHRPGRRVADGHRPAHASVPGS